MSDPNPYESPKEVNSPPTVKAGVAIGTLLLLSIPAAALYGATTADTRWSGLPDVPTVEQALGLQGYDVRTWFGLAGPAGLPRTIVDLGRHIRRVNIL